MCGWASLIPRLPLPAWRLLGADALSAVGSGLTLPFLLVYLHSVRGYGLALAGAVAACIGVAGVVGNPLGGWLVDRWSPRGALTVGLAAAGLGAAGLALAIRPWLAFAAAGLSGLGVSVGWPALDALLARLVVPALRSSVFAARHMCMNAGFGVGGLLAAVVVDVSRPATFTTVYLLDAASFIAALAVVATVRIPVPALSAASVPIAELGVDREAHLTASVQGRGGGGYVRVLRDRAFVGVWLLAALLATVGFGQFNTTMPVFATEDAGLTAGDLGFVFAANTIAVVVFQLVVLRVLARRRRTRAVMLVGPLWGLCWALVLAGGLLDRKAAVLGVFVAVGVVFALGETLLSPTLPAIVNDIAPDALRGRYNGAFTLALTTGFVLGPLLGGFALERDLAAPLLVVLVAASAVCAVAAYGLERIVPPRMNLVPAPDAHVLASVVGSGPGTITAEQRA